LSSSSLFEPHANAVIDKIRRHVAVRKAVLKAGKERHDLVRDIAIRGESFRAQASLMWSY